MFEVPAVTDVTNPAASIVATAVLLLLQVPDTMVLPRADVAPLQIDVVPVIAAGMPVTSDDVVLMQLETA